MSSRPRRTATPARPRINRRFPRPSYRPPSLPAPARRIFRRRLDRPAFRPRPPRTFNSYLGLGVTLGLVCILGTALLVFERAFSTRVMAHVSVDGISLGGVPLADAPGYLRRKLAARDSQPVLLHAGTRTFQVDSVQFHARYDYQAALQQALAAGHESDLFGRVWSQLGILVHGTDYPIRGSHDQAAVRSYLAKVDEQISVQPLPAIVGRDGATVAILREPVPGRRLDREGAAALLDRAINAHNVFDIALPIQITTSPVSHDIAQATVNQAQALLSQPTYFSFGTKAKHWVLPPDQLVRLFTFATRYDPRAGWSIDLGLDQGKLRKTMAEIAPEVNIAPVPAYYKVARGSDQDYAVPQPDIPGLAIDTDRVSQLILKIGPQHTVTLPLIHPRAAFDLRAARKLNFDLEQGKGPALWAGSSPQRVINISAAARALDSIRLNPGQTLSVTSVISPATSVNGYTVDLNSLSASDSSGANGGTTQVASALFQAAYQAGLPILKRTPYFYATAFDGPLGYDAMVVARPHGPDLQFVNDTKHILLINVVSYTKDRAVVAYIFNNNLVKRTVRVGEPVLTLNQDGSIDAIISRTISGDTTSQDSVVSHYEALDPYP